MSKFFFSHWQFRARLALRVWNLRADPVGSSDVEFYAPLQQPSFVYSHHRAEHYVIYD